MKWVLLVALAVPALAGTDDLKCEPPKVRWGSIRYDYEALPKELRVHVVVENTSTGPVTRVTLPVFKLKSLGEPQHLDQPVFSVEGPALVTGRGSEGAVVFYNPNPGRPLMLQLQADRKGEIGCTVGLGGDRVILDNVVAARPIPPGGTDAFTVAVRVGAGDPLDLAEDLLAAYRQKFPRLLKWEDRRPIVRAFFGGGLPKDEALARLKDPDHATVPEPDQKFQAVFFRKIQSCIENARTVNAQGIVIWDLEGETFPHAVTYIGDPRLIRVLNPQMDLVIDEGMKRLKEAGLRVGVTLRPSRVVYDEKKGAASHSHTIAADPFLEYDGKIAYARKRWGATLFYLDTNYFWRPYGDAREWQSAQIPGEVYRRLLAKYPDILLIPEIGQVAAYDATIPYGEADMGNWGTPALARRLWPDACRIIVIEDADPLVLHDRFVQTVRDRNILMTQVGGGGTTLPALNRIYGEAGAGDPPALPGDAAALVALALDPKAEWLTRKRALVALAGTSFRGSVPELLALVADRQGGLSHFAVLALAAQGTNAVPAVLARLREEKTPWAFGSLGEVLVVAKAADSAVTLQEIYTANPKLPAMTRRALLEVIGQLRNPASESFLLGVFHDTQSPAAAEALVRLGSATAIAEVRKAMDEAKRAGNSDAAGMLGKALQAK